MKQKLSDYSFEVKRQHEQRIVGIILFALIVFLGITLIRSFLIFSVRTRSSSMTPDIPENACIFFTPITGNISRGDVVLLRSRSPQKMSIFKIAGNMLAKFFTAQQYEPFTATDKMGESEQLRRVVALPGDTIYIKDYIAFIKPKGETHFLSEHERAKTSYNIYINSELSKQTSTVGIKSSFEQITLKENEYFVLADNRASAIDSRLWSPLQRDSILAKAIAVYYPFSKFHLF